MIMKQTSVADRRSIIHQNPLPLPDQVVKTDPTSGKIYLGQYEPIDQEKVNSSFFELDASLKTGKNLDPVMPIDYSSFDQRLAYVEQSLSSLSSKTAKVNETVESSKSE